MGVKLLWSSAITVCAALLMPLEVWARDVSGAVVQTPIISAMETWVAQTGAESPQQTEANQLFDEAFQHWQRGEYPIAIEKLETALELYRQVDNQRGENWTLTGLGAVHADQGLYTEALEYYQQALQIAQGIKDPDGEGTALNNIGAVYDHLGQHLEALDYFHRALAIRQTIGAQLEEGQSLQNIGFIYSRLGQYSEALNYYEHALEIFRALESQISVGVVLHNIGFIYKNLGQYELALNYLNQSLIIRQETGNRYGEAVSLSSIGQIYAKQGQYGSALDRFQQSLDIRQDIGDRSGEAESLNNIGFMYDRLGRYSEALKYYQQSLAIREAIGDKPGQGTTLNNIGIIYSHLGQYDSALDNLQRSLAIRRAIGAQAGEGTTLNNVGLIYSYLDQHDLALNYYWQSLTICQAIGDRFGEGVSLNSIGELYYSLGQYDLALNYYHKSLVIRQDIGDYAGQGLTLNNIGDVLNALEYSVLAIPYFKLSVNSYEAIRASNQALSWDLQQSYTDTIASTYRKLASLLLQQDRILEAQRVLDLLKVQELDDYLGGVRSEATTVSGIELLPQEQALFAHRERILAQAVATSSELQELRQIPFQERSEEQNRRIIALQELQGDIHRQFMAFIESEEVQQLIAQLSRTARDQDVVAQLNRFPELQNNLHDIGNAVLLYPLILDDRLELVLVTADGPPMRHPVAVSRQELTAAIVAFQGAIRDRNSDLSTVQRQAQQLYQWLMADLEPAMAAVEAETILYAPDGPLRYIPLAALHDGEQWLAQRYRINQITAASLTNLNLRRSRPAEVLAGAFPAAGRFEVPAGNITLEFRGLPYAGVEVNNLSELFPTTPFYEADFSRRATEPLFNDHTIVHLATHAALLIGSPQDSFILFGNGDRLTLEDLKAWNDGSRLNRVELVVLSACETGTGSIRDANGEEILGFGYLMQAAGAQAVMASLWPVSDGGTQELMTNFYEALRVPGMTKAEALQQAQVALITGHQIDASAGQRFTWVPRDPDAAAPLPMSRLSHPYYWASFILIGNGL